MKKFEIECLHHKHGHVSYKRYWVMAKTPAGAIRRLYKDMKGAKFSMVKVLEDEYIQESEPANT